MNRSDSHFPAYMVAGEWGLNGLAYLALRVAPPIQAKTWVARVGRLFPPLGNVEEARGMNERLGTRGTCLSRSLAVAARYPGSVVVLGVRLNGTTARKSRCLLEAHAWVEIGGVPIGEDALDQWTELGRMAL